MIWIPCPTCLMSFSVSDQDAGKDTNCPVCKTKVRVPGTTANTPVAVAEPVVEAPAAKPVTEPPIARPAMDVPMVRPMVAVPVAMPAADIVRRPVEVPVARVAPAAPTSVPVARVSGDDERPEPLARKLTQARDTERDDEEGDHYDLKDRESNRLDEDLKRLRKKKP